MSGNTKFGEGSLQNNKSNQNSAFGANSLRKNKKGTQNTAMGS
jgi:hypothetical protein